MTPQRECEASISGMCLLITQGYLSPFPCRQGCELAPDDEEEDVTA